MALRLLHLCLLFGVLLLRLDLLVSSCHAEKAQRWDVSAQAGPEINNPKHKHRTSQTSGQCDSLDGRFLLVLLDTRHTGGSNGSFFQICGVQTPLSCTLLPPQLCKLKPKTHETVVSTLRTGLMSYFHRPACRRLQRAFEILTFHFPVTFEDKVHLHHE